LDSFRNSCFFSLEFDIWYSECYLNENSTGGIGDLTSSNKNTNDYRAYDDAAERFERMQKDLLLSDLDSMPFRQAQMKANRRVNYKSIINFEFLPCCFLF
jgi:hypothetical protein